LKNEKSHTGMGIGSQTKKHGIEMLWRQILCFMPPVVVGQNKKKKR
jgi:hypothetical protein